MCLNAADIGYNHHPYSFTRSLGERGIGNRQNYDSGYV